MHTGQTKMKMFNYVHLQFASLCVNNFVGLYLRNYQWKLKPKTYTQITRNLFLNGEKLTKKWPKASTNTKIKETNKQVTILI